MKFAFPRAVVFDWDHTLVDTWGVITESLNAVRRKFGQELWTEEEARQRSQRALRESFPDWYGKDWEKARDIFYTSYRQSHLDLIKAMPGADELLRFLAGVGVPLFAVSNKNGRDLRLEADKLGWGDYFVALVGATDAAKDKPARDPVDLVLGKGGLKADDLTIWFVGDKPIDVECARHAGLTPVLVGNPEDAALLDVGLSFSDCHALRDLLYNAANGKTAGSSEND
ncbi:MAG: HAD family hydrolase [Alphaproteobacteria bacterium]|nr:HAD family hydrolase [Alphaproteobacteria bacterium]